jgi:hypothetical protein
MIRQVRRWLPDWSIVIVGDSSYAVLQLLACAARMKRPVTVVTRFDWMPPSMMRLQNAKQTPKGVRVSRGNANPA